MSSSAASLKAAKPGENDVASSTHSLNKPKERKKSISGEKKKSQKKLSNEDTKAQKEPKMGEEEEEESTSSSRRKSRVLAKRMSRMGSESPSYEGRIDPDEPLPATKYVSWLIQRPVILRTARAGPLAQKPMTVMSVLRDTVNKQPNKLAYGADTRGQSGHAPNPFGPSSHEFSRSCKSTQREQEASLVDDKWVKVTYQDLLDQVRHAARSFIKLGLQRFNGVGILGHDCTEFVVVHLGVIFAGGVSVPLHMNTSDEFSLNLVKAAQCRILVVDLVKLRPQVLEWQKTLPNLKTIVQFDQEKTDDALATDIPVGQVKTDTTDKRRVYTWEDFMKLGNGVAPDVLVTRTLQQAPNLCCCILQTSGNSGYPRNVMLSHDNLNWGSYTSGRYMSLSDGNGVVVNIAPFSTILGMSVGINIPIRFGSSVYLIPVFRNKDIVIRVLREIRPTIFFGPTIFYAFVRRELEARMRRKSIFARILVSWAMKVGRSGFDDHTRLTNPPGFWKIANRLLFRIVRRQLGLDACKETVASADFMTKPNLEFFLSIDMPLLLAYGMVESTGSHAFCSAERFRIGSVGLGMDGCDARIVNPDANGVGELCIGGRNVAMGYLDNEELTKQFFDEDGTFRTGDLARKDSEGFIYIVGVKYDVVTLLGGVKVSTIPIVLSVKSNLPFVSNALAVGEGRDYLSMLMTIKTEMDLKTEQPSDQLTENSVRWFRKAGFDVRLVRDIVPKANPKLMVKIQTIIDRINAESLHVAHQIKRWTFLSNDFTTQSDELSPTLRPRRWVLVKKYAATIDSMYP